ncbi:unnamed protein product [Ranitomeya imitator]|uniref:Ig-like domain-containing protein n=1 Tax=Ranitomeya imitator TaxID=111125 RepID=A0ABN9KY15_9NEOB|nr:unnamed protein product [Ranitomeya imitator]
MYISRTPCTCRAGLYISRTYLYQLCQRPVATDLAQVNIRDTLKAPRGKTHIFKRINKVHEILLSQEDVIRMINGSLSINNVSYTDEGIYVLNVIPHGSSTAVPTNYQLRVYEGGSSAEIARLLKCDHRTIKRFMANSQQGRKKRVGQKRRKIIAHELRKIKREPAKMPFATSFAIFQSCNVTGVTKSTSTPLINGTNVTLQCDAGSQNVTSYTFYRNGQNITCSGRVICRGSFLDFTPILESDGGSYTCTIENPVSSNTSNSLILTVIAPLSAPALHSVTSAPLINGTNVTLQCDAGNQNVTSYSFYQNGQKITCSGRVICRGSFLDFAPILESDGGSYTCTIENPVSSNTSNSLILIVNVQVSNVAVTSNVSGLVWPGLDSVSLRCSADGTNVSYSWSLQGAAISGGGRYLLTDNNATLIISPVSTDDSGSFICTATNIINRLNSRNVTFNLASPVSAVMLTNNTSAVLWAGEDSASFHCSAQGSAITFSWRLNGTQVLSKPPYSITQSDSPPNSTLTISPVSRNDAGPFTCTAYNRANSITSGAANLNINWAPDGNISCTAQPIGQIIQLGCSWPGGKPAADVTMIFDDVRNTSSNEVSRNVSSISKYPREQSHL